MLWFGVMFLLVGAVCSAFKIRIVWDVAHDVYNGGGVPTLDFPLFYPLPIVVGANMVAFELGGPPFAAFGFAVYFGLAIGFGLLLWLFDRLGAPERQRQLEAIRSLPQANTNDGKPAEPTKN